MTAYGLTSSLVMQEVAGVLDKPIVMPRPRNLEERDAEFSKPTLAAGLRRRGDDFLPEPLRSRAREGPWSFHRGPNLMLVDDDRAPSSGHGSMVLRMQGRSLSPAFLSADERARTAECRADQGANLLGFLVRDVSQGFRQEVDRWARDVRREVARLVRDGHGFTEVLEVVLIRMACGAVTLFSVNDTQLQLAAWSLRTDTRPQPPAALVWKPDPSYSIRGAPDGDLLGDPLFLSAAEVDKLPDASFSKWGGLTHALAQHDASLAPGRHRCVVLLPLKVDNGSPAHGLLRIDGIDQPAPAGNDPADADSARVPAFLRPVLEEIAEVLATKPMLAAAGVGGPAEKGFSSWVKRVIREKAREEVVRELERLRQHSTQTEAAQALGISVRTLSSGLRDLEKAKGLKLWPHEIPWRRRGRPAGPGGRHSHRDRT